MIPRSPRSSQLLRSVDWRFLLRQSRVPKALDLRSKADPEALRLVTQPAARSQNGADLVVLGFPTNRRLRAARGALRAGGEIVCIWRAPRPAGVQRARARLRRAGFGDSHFYWPGPDPRRQPAFWLPLGAAEAVDRFLAQRPSQSRGQSAMRFLWRLAERCGALAPVFGVARGDATLELPDELGELLPAPDPWVLLSGGQESLNKIVGLPFADDPSRPPSVVVKFSRVEGSDALLEREAEILRRLERERPTLGGVPRLRATGWRAGRLAIAQSAASGSRLETELSEASFADLAPALTRWLLALAGEPPRQPPSAWLERLAWNPLEALQDRYPGALQPREVASLRELLGDLRDLPLVWTHRDCGPWNILRGEDGALALIDWEWAEPEGPPGTDLASFLLSSTLIANGAQGDPSGRLAPALDAHRRMLDPSTTLGRTAGECVAAYCHGLGIDPELFPRLRMLCWIHQAVSFWSSSSVAAAAGPISEPFQPMAMVELVREEMRLLGERR